MLVSKLIAVGATAGLILGASAVDPGVPVEPEVISDEEIRPADEELFLENESSQAVQESEDVGEALNESAEDPEEPTVATYEPRFLDEAVVTGDSSPGVVTASFPIPADCEAGAVPAELSCATGMVTYSSTIVDDNGELFAAQTSADSTSIYITSDVEENMQYPVIFTVYLTDSATPEILDEAESTLAWMVATDQGEGISSSDLDAEERFLNESVEDAAAPPVEGPEAGASSIDPAVLAPVHASLGLSSRHESAVIVPAASSRPSKVLIPRSYRYCPNTCKPKARHDYCTSPAVNYWVTTRGAADFRGPCARHDMMIASIAKKSITSNSKRAQRRDGDVRFRSHLQQNCRNGFYTRTQSTSKASCFVATAGYYAAVSYTTNNWRGQ